MHTPENGAPQKMNAKWLQSSVMWQERKFPLRHDTTVDGELDAMQPGMIKAGGDLAERLPTLGAMNFSGRQDDFFPQVGFRTERAVGFLVMHDDVEA